MRIRLPLLLLATAVLFGFTFILLWRAQRRTPSLNSQIPAEPASAPSETSASGSRLTDVYAHNLMLRKGPSFRIYVRWLRGQMVPSRRNVNPSFDDPESFLINITSGVIRVNIGDIGNYLNADGLGNSPLKKVTLSGNGNQIKLAGTLHKIIPLPVEVVGEIGPLPDGRIQIHVTKIDVLKIPFKAVLGGLHVEVSDLFHAQNIPGIQVTGNDIYLDPVQLLPPPHIRGHLTAVRVVNPDLEEIYGNAETEVQHVEQWRNFLRLNGGAIDFGRLTMHPVDLIMIDVSSDAWFDLDLAHYQKQLVYGYTRMTAAAGLQIFMPDLQNVPHNQAAQDNSIQWMKNRALPPPNAVIHH